MRFVFLCVVMGNARMCFFGTGVSEHVARKKQTSWFLKDEIRGPSEKRQFIIYEEYAEIRNAVHRCDTYRQSG